MASLPQKESQHTKMNVYAVIVTYSDRFQLYEQVVFSLISEGIKKVIIVDNDSSETSKDKLKKLGGELGNKLKVLWLDKNTGSANGFKVGITAALEEDLCDFLWLLDDDNKPSKGALQACLDYWESNDLNRVSDSTCLVSFRPDRPWHKYAIYKNRPDYVIGPMNSFMRFHLLWTPFFSLEKILDKIFSNEKTNIRSGVISVSPYGGMFFHKDLIGKIGLPCEDFFVYADDNEFSYRITNSGGKVILLMDSVIEDIDQSWDTGPKTSFLKILEDGTSARVYYSLRNRTFLEVNNRVKNRFIYKLNRNSWLLSMHVLSFLVSRRSRMALIQKAIDEGLSGKLGKRNDQVF